MEVTAYCPCEKCCGSHADGITASGYEIKPGDILIAAPRTFRFGTRMNIPGYGIAEVKDRGGAIKGNRLDVYFGTHQEALEWGRQKLMVQVLGS
jgi:3D (Asp-Asp-Asp) domain-containing protein